MFKIYIFADSYKHFDIAIKEYEKRLGKSIELIKLKPSKNINNSQVIEEETSKIIEVCEKDKGYKIVLSPKGKNFDTDSFYNLIELKKQTFSQISFFIGGANGFDYKKLDDYVDLKLSLSDFIMPHSLALLVLLEQIYRLSMIKKGSNYNK